MTDDSVLALQQRVADGLVWLSEHDPGSAFHLWFEAGIPISGPFPSKAGQPAGEAQIAAYAEYVPARQLWEKLSERLARVDPLWQTQPPSSLNWRGGRYGTTTTGG